MFEDLFTDDDFLIEPELDDEVENGNEPWDTGIQPDIFASGAEQDIFTTINI